MRAGGRSRGGRLSHPPGVQAPLTGKPARLPGVADEDGDRAFGAGGSLRLRRLRLAARRVHPPRGAGGAGNPRLGAEGDVRRGGGARRPGTRRDDERRRTVRAPDHGYSFRPRPPAQVRVAVRVEEGHGAPLLHQLAAEQKQVHRTGRGLRVEDHLPRRTPAGGGAGAQRAAARPGAVRRKRSVEGDAGEVDPPVVRRQRGPLGCGLLRDGGRHLVEHAAFLLRGESADPEGMTPQGGRHRAPHAAANGRAAGEEPPDAVDLARVSRQHRIGQEVDEPVRDPVRVGAAGWFDERGGRQCADRLRIERASQVVVHPVHVPQVRQRVRGDERGVLLAVRDPPAAGARFRQGRQVPQRRDRDQRVRADRGNLARALRQGFVRPVEPHSTLGMEEIANQIRLVQTLQASLRAWRFGCARH